MGSLAPVSLAVVATLATVAADGITVCPGTHGITVCPGRVDVRGRLPGVRAEHERVAYWLARRADADVPLLPAPAPLRDDAALAHVDAAEVRRQVASLQTLARTRLADRRWLDAGGRPLDPSTLPELGWEVPETLAPELRVVLAPAQLRCVPLPVVLRAADDPELADDANACSRLEPQEVVEVLAEGPGTQRLVRTRFALGWIGRSTMLSPRVPAALAAAFVRGERVMATRDVRLGAAEIPARSSLPLAPGRDDRVLLATRAGIVEAARDDALASTRRPLTRRAILEAAFPLLGRRYGLGGTDGGLDCSALIRDAFATVGLELPRHSADQARAGTTTVDLGGVVGRDARLALLDDADRRGVVVLHLPGHVALYLGRDAGGVPMALHALGAYRTPCAGGDGETRHVVRRVVVSGLDLGAGTRDGSLLERIDTLAVFGRVR